MARTSVSRSAAGTRTASSRSANYPLVNPNLGTLFEDFETFANWTKGSGSGSPTGTLASDTTHFKTGTQGMTVNATNGGIYMTKTINSVISTPNTIGFWAYIVGKASLVSMTVYIASAANFSKFFSASIIAAKLNEGWNFINFSTADFTNTGSDSWLNTMVAMRFRVDTIANQSVSVTFDSMYIGLTSRPKLIITFDDGWKTQSTQAYAYMSSLGLKGCSMLIKDAVNTAGYMTDADILEMYNAGWDMCTHGLYNLTTLADKAAMIDDIQHNQNYLINHGLTRDECHKHYVYPLGGNNATTLQALIDCGMLTGRTIVSAGMQVSKGVDNVYCLKGRELRSDTVNLATAKGYIDSCIGRDETVILFAHKIEDVPAVYTEWATADFRSLMDYIKAKVDANLLDVVTMTEWYASLSNPRRVV